jgi:hypothetical protein
MAGILVKGLFHTLILAHARALPNADWQRSATGNSALPLAIRLLSIVTALKALGCISPAFLLNFNL